MVSLRWLHSSDRDIRARARASPSDTIMTSWTDASTNSLLLNVSFIPKHQHEVKNLHNYLFMQSIDLA